ncbi:MAG: hypothetical protein PWQ57_2202 [Desulfovibrionales bacterium]|nr:hypothetical protein [Desulfovibrionales bacterium]
MNGQPPPSRSNGAAWFSDGLMGAQHMALVLSGIVLIPTMLGAIYHIPHAQLHDMMFATAVGAAIASALQMLTCKHFGLGEVLFMSTASAYLPCAHTALELGGVQLLAALGLLSAVVRVVYGLFLYRLRHIVTPTVGGVIIMLAVTGLLKDAAVTWSGPAFLSGPLAHKRLAVGALTMAVMLVAERAAGRRLRPWGLIFGLVAGSLAAWLAGLFDLSSVRNAEWFGAPNLKASLHLGEMTLEKCFLFLTFAVAALVTCIKYTGDAMVVQRIAHPDKSKNDFEAIQSGVYASAVGSLPSCFLGGMPIASHSSNVALLSLTSSTSRRVGWIGCLLTVCVAFCPKLLFAMLAIPGPVLGATGVVLVGHLFASGMQLAASQGLRYRNGLIVGLSLVLGLLVSDDSFFPNAYPEFLAPLVKNGFAVGGITAILMTLGLEVASGRRTVIRLRSKQEDISLIWSQTAAFSERHGLSLRDGRFLELACDETVCHMIREMGKNGAQGMITLTLTRGEDDVQVEATAKARMSEVDLAEAPDLERASEEDLQRLGLLLLNSTAKDVTHLHIAGYTVIKFSLPTTG